MASIDLIRASNGSGDAVKATVTNARVISSTTLQIDATTNWPNKFIATVGDVDGTGAFVPATVTVFNGILSGGNIEITSFAPGYTDIGNTPGQVVVLKPTTAWANEVADTLAVAHNDNGTLKANSVTSTALAAGSVTSNKIDWTTVSTIEKKLVSSTTTSSTTTVILTVPHAELIVGAKYKVTGQVLVNKGNDSYSDSDMYLRHGSTVLTQTLVSGAYWTINYLQATVVYSSGDINLTGNSNGKTISSIGTNLIVQRVG